MMRSADRPVVWLAGFPSSGGLKAQIGVANLVYGRVGSIPELDEKIPPMQPVPLVQIPEGALGPDFNCVFTHHVANPVFLRTVRTAGIIYVLRHPVDAGISSSGYLLPREIDFATASDEAIKRLQTRLIDEFLKIGTFRQYQGFGYGTWVEHVRSWIEFADKHQIAFHLVTFDSMRQEPDAALHGIARFLDLNVADAHIADAADNWSIEVSRRMEEDVIRNRIRCRLYKPAWQAAYDRGWRYHGKGLSGYGRDNLTDEQWAIAHKTFAATAAQLGIAVGP